MMQNLRMGQLIVEYKGKKLDYLINLEMSQKAQDETVEGILRYYPPDVDIEFIELY